MMPSKKASWSPFGEGGINPYVYCAGDPINRAAPSGHMSWQAKLGIASGALGILLAGITFGASLAAYGLAATSAHPQWIKNLCH
ncbi:hypothetical protein [Rouxiella sp. WC2420]|uniref:RHS repeat-associated core domain-containing protein n=1 Tax=Rouxiella sp. WC2420 TaxID=3234145 RepID=A0AB39VWM9_9GAMM